MRKVRPPHPVPLGTSGWILWRDFVSRGAGLPVAELYALRQPEVAELARRSRESSASEGNDNSRINGSARPSLGKTPRPWATLWTG